jgi:hypothetical protein
MRYELKSPEALEITFEVIIGGLGVPGLAPEVFILDIVTNNLLDNTAPGPAYVFTPGPIGPNHIFIMNPTAFQGLYLFNLTVPHITHSTGTRGYLVYIKEPVNNISEYIHLTVTDRTIIAADTIAWGGDPSAIQTSAAGIGAPANHLPAITLYGWGGDASADISVTATGSNFPNINVGDYAGSLAASSIAGMPDSNVVDWNGLVDGGSAAPLGVGASGYPLVDASLGGVTDANVVQWHGGFAASSIADPHMPRVDLEKIKGFFASTTAMPGVFDTNTVYWQGDGAAVSVGLNGTPNVHVFQEGITSNSFAEGAIDEDAIQIDSVTYEELSDSAVREIVNGVWGANVISPMDISGNYSGSLFGMSEPGTMGHAMMVDYLSQNMVHVYSLGSDIYASPMHQTNQNDPGGSKFYSEELASTPLASPEESLSYIERSGVLVRGIAVPNGLDSAMVSFNLTLAEEDSWGDGWNGALFQVTNSLGVIVASETLEPAPDGSVGVDAFSLPGGDTYTWAFSGGSFYSEIGFELILDATGEVLVSVDPAELADDGMTLLVNAGGAFTLAPVADTIHQHHLVRVSEVGLDSSGQYFGIHLMDEEKSPIPDGILQGDLLFIKAETDTTAHEIAHEVWEEPVAAHSTPHTFGMFNRIMAGLTQFNHRITDPQYDQSGRLIACRLVVYENAADAQAEQNPLSTVVVSSTYDDKQNMKTFLAKEES